MQLYLVGTYEEVQAANAQIESNANIPNEETQHWDIPNKAYEQDLWFICKPSEDGWNGFSQEDMMRNVIDVKEMEYQPEWLAPDNIF